MYISVRTHFICSYVPPSIGPTVFGSVVVGAFVVVGFVVVGFTVVGFAVVGFAVVGAFVVIGFVVVGFVTTTGFVVVVVEHVSQVTGHFVLYFEREHRSSTTSLERYLKPWHSHSSSHSAVLRESDELHSI